ncbi:hypothetical protein [Phormidesmis priestleyi]|uniref:hypothetical protein n=1 Tax=Phormidesmis priestleyi TaxID=268141 RepID=UPI00083B6246|nr:hypothetical protein [Phormidesmis priestleyi]
MKVSTYHVEQVHTPDGKNPYPESLPPYISGDWFPFIPRVGDCFWHNRVYWQIKSLAYRVGKGSHEDIRIELIVFYAGLK